MASWPAKDPDDVLDYSLDWSKQMTKDADTIASYDPFVLPEGSSLAIVTDVGKTPDHDDTKTIVWLRGGKVDQSYEVVNRITTAAGRQYDHTRTIKIKDR